MKINELIASSAEITSYNHQTNEFTEAFDRIYRPYAIDVVEGIESTTDEQNNNG